MDNNTLQQILKIANQIRQGKTANNAIFGNEFNANDYWRQVQQEKQYPFFNQENTPLQWASRVVQEFKNRGSVEGLHGIANPVLMNPYVSPIAAPMVSTARINAEQRPNLDYKTLILRNLLGMPPVRRYPVYPGRYLPNPEERTTQ